MQGRLKELAVSVGQGWFVVVVGVGLGVYGLVELIAHSKTTGWVWITVGLVSLLLVALNVAYQALRQRDAVLAGRKSSETSVARPIVFHGGEHKHFHSSPPEEGDSTTKRS